MLSAALMYPLSSIAIVLTAFLAMPWPGYALLHLLGHGRHRWSEALFAGPAVTLAMWIVVLSGAAWASIPLKTIFGPVWLATLLLAILGIALRLSIRRRVVISGPALRDNRILWAVAITLPLLIMPATFRFGLGDFVNSTYADPWSYIMVADYLSSVARGTEGGLSALHQYASHLMNTRNASSAILAHLAYGFGGAKADQTVTLFCLLLLFSNVAALICLARSIFGRTEAAVGLAVLAGLGWPANIVFAGNFDQLLLLPMLPMIAVFAQRAGARNNLVAAGLLIGLLAAAALLAYVELAFIGVVIAMTFVIVPGVRFAPAIGRALLATCVAVPILIVLSWTGFDSLMTMLKGQYALTTVSATAARPGEGYFLGLLSAYRLPDTLWALGGELQQTRSIILPWILGAMLTALMLIGAWHERRRWAVLIGLAVISVAVVHFNFREHYSYATYKIVSINAWMISALAVAGGIWLARYAKPRLPRQISIATVVGALIVIIAADRTIVQANIIRFKQNALQQRAYREALIIDAKVKDAPTLLSVRDPLANEWAVFYLSDMPLMIVPYRLYMAQAHVIPFMDRAKPVDPAAVRFIVTDRNDATQASVSGAERIWDGEVYSLWKVDNDEWTVLADVINPNGLEPTGIWLGGPQADFIVVASKAGLATLDADFQAGPRAVAGTKLFHLRITDGAGVHNRDVAVGGNKLPVHLASGKSLISIGVDNAATEPKAENGDTRPMVLRMLGYGIRRGDNPLP